MTNQDSIDLSDLRGMVSFPDKGNHHSRMAMNLVAADKHFVIEVVKSLKCSKMQCAIIQ